MQLYRRVVREIETNYSTCTGLEFTGSNWLTCHQKIMCWGTEERNGEIKK